MFLSLRDPAGIERASNFVAHTSMRSLQAAYSRAPASVRQLPHKGARSRKPARPAGSFSRASALASIICRRCHASTVTTDRGQQHAAARRVSHHHSFSDRTVRPTFVLCFGCCCCSRAAIVAASASAVSRDTPGFSRATVSRCQLLRCVPMKPSSYSRGVHSVASSGNANRSGMTPITTVGRPLSVIARFTIVDRRQSCSARAHDQDDTSVRPVRSIHRRRSARCSRASSQAKTTRYFSAIKANGSPTLSECIPNVYARAFVDVSCVEDRRSSVRDRGRCRRR